MAVASDLASHSHELAALALSWAISGSRQALSPHHVDNPQFSSFFLGFTISSWCSKAEFFFLDP